MLICVYFYSAERIPERKLIKRQSLPFFFKYEPHFITQFLKERKFALIAACVRKLFIFTWGILKAGLTEDVCTSEAKSPSPSHCHLSLSYYAPTFAMLALKHRATGQPDLLSLTWFVPIAVSAMGDRLKTTDDLGSASPLRLCVDYPALQGVEIHPICRHATLLQLGARAIVCSRTRRLDNQVKLIHGNIRVIVHRVGEQFCC